jgi:hypothetical protein
VAFCTQQLRDESGGRCGCSGDLSLDSLVVLGGKEAFWDPVDFASEDAALCLDATGKKEEGASGEFWSVYIGGTGVRGLIRAGV